MSFKEIWTRANNVSKFIFILAVIYILGGIWVLLTALGVISETSYNDPVLLIVFTMVSFALTVFICTYHLSNLIRRRKRLTDKIADGKVQTAN